MQPILLEFLADIKVAIPPTKMAELKKNYKDAYNEHFRYRLAEALRKRAAVDADKAVDDLLSRLNVDEALAEDEDEEDE